MSDTNYSINSMKPKDPPSIAEKTEDRKPTKIRIGNDIKMVVALKSLSDFDITAIKLLKCYIIRKDDHIKDPLISDDLKGAYDDLNNPYTKIVDVDGSWSYVGDLGEYTIGDLHVIPPFHEPDMYRFDICGPHGYHFQPWNAWYEHPHERRPLWRFFLHHGGGLHSMPEKGYGPYYGVKKDDRIPAYLAPCSVANKKSTINVYFPALEQVACGTYCLAIQIVSYEPGYGPKNLHTRFVEYDDVFELVNNASGNSGDITIAVGGDADGLACDCESIPVDDPGTLDTKGVNPIDSLLEILV